MGKEIFKELNEQAQYALNSNSRDLVYQTYGAACMARQLNAISADEYLKLNEMLVRNGLNNPKAKLK